MATAIVSKSLMQRGSNIGIAIGFIGILAIMLGQVPPFILNLLLAINITFALMVLMLSLYMTNPLEFTTFPSVLLILTFYRLALNVASTKLILMPASGVTQKAGAMIDFFGRVVAGNNAIIGFIVFLILIIIQFIVITKGSGRIAEVAARFTLDAMPGKQMAIDADLNAGLITEGDARRRRAEIAREADFYGAMDGASKFVRGDAVAGIIITLINIVGGIGVGFSEEGMEIPSILSTYTILTIGDGLVSQIPALLTALAAGVVVTRASEETALGESLSKQLFNKPEAMFVASAALFLIAALGVMMEPGIVFPFILIAAILGGSAWLVKVTQARSVIQEEEIAKKEEEEKPPEPEDVESLLEVDPMEIEIGFGLIPIVDSEQGGDLLDRVGIIRRQTAVELGLIVPPIRIRDNMQLGPRLYNIMIRGIKVADGEIRPERLLAMKPGMEEDDEVPGIKGIEPAFHTPAKWIEPDERSRAEMAGYSVVEPAAVMATHLTEVIKSHAYELLGRQEVQQLIDNLRESNAVLIDEIIEKSQIKVGLIQKVLQNLLRERVPIRHLEMIFEAIADYAQTAQMNPDTLTEFCRMNLARVITNLYLDQSGQVPVITLDPNIESRIQEEMQRAPAGIMATDPIYAEHVISAIQGECNNAMISGYHPLVLTQPSIRAHLRRLCERTIPHIIVLSFNEISQEVGVSRIATVRLQSESQKVPS